MTTMRSTWRQSKLARGILITVPVLLPSLIFIGTGLYGLDYGYHWDEELQLKLVEQSIASGILLPSGFYQYPSMTYWLSFASIWVEVIPFVLGEGVTEDLGHVVNNQTTGFRTDLRAAVQSQAYLLRTRSVFLVVSALALLWVYLTALARRRSWLEALLAASILAVSWELAYHARWIAPDAILAQLAH